MKAYNLITRDRLEILPWMRWCPYILGAKLTEEEWFQITLTSVTATEKAEILKQKKL